MKYTNALIESSSPYLLQHAHNPVNWYPWSDDILEEARKSEKLLLISIGYAACHWCHVMEHESFEDEEVASAMNNNFVCVKVDREERPDVDHYYMSAVQLMRQQGGWPLNVIALPDGRPIWGGTYFPKDVWTGNIEAVADFYKNNKQKTLDYADQLQKGITQVSLTADVENVISVNEKLLERGVDGWKSRWDMEEGGNSGAPKFPMPVNLEFLLYYGQMKNDSKSLEFVKTTLEKIARGGIYDQLGGGFARYAVDDKWKIPHFEKMLYDNGQLLGLYSKAYQQFKKEEFKTVVYETVHFIERELMHESGAFYSSLDADSEGEEGKFYVWKKLELEQILETNYQLFADYYHVNGKGFWEHGNNILLRDEDNESFALKHNLSVSELQTMISKWKFSLLKERQNRVRPGLDDKSLCSWNALTVQGLVDAYKAFKDEYFLNLALKNALFLKENLLNENGKLFRNWKDGKTSIDAFSEDYALFVQASLSLFEVTGNEDWLGLAEKVVSYCLEHFYNKEAGLFYFSEKDKESVVLNHYQKEDNVIPSANSVMANNLHRLSLLLARPEYSDILKRMLHHITPHFTNYPMAYANWGSAMLKLTQPYHEVVVCGINANNLLTELQDGFQPNILWAFANNESDIPLLKNRFVLGEDLIYVCSNGACQLPVKTAQEALDIVHRTQV